MSADAYRQIIAAPPRDGLDLFLATANRIGAPIGNVEKDFWVYWTLSMRSITNGPRESRGCSSRAARPYRKAMTLLLSLIHI